MNPPTALWVMGLLACVALLGQNYASNANIANIDFRTISDNSLMMMMMTTKKFWNENCSVIALLNDRQILEHDNIVLRFALIQYDYVGERQSVISYFSCVQEHKGEHGCWWENAIYQRREWMNRNVHWQHGITNLFIDCIKFIRVYWLHLVVSNNCCCWNLLLSSCKNDFRITKYRHHVA